MTTVGSPGGDLVLIGGGEHARVVLDAARRQGVWSVVGFVDPKPRPDLASLGLTWLGDDISVGESLRGAHCVLTVGGVAETARRQEIVGRYEDRGVVWSTVVHPDTVVAESAVLMDGVVVLAGALINPGVHVSEHCIVNTGATLEHDVYLEPFAHIGPRAIVGGGTIVGRGAYVGLGGKVRDHIRIGAGAVVGMGAVVTRPVPDGLTVIGVPARPITSRSHE
jgi:acetyltransferase EpsM